MLIETKMRTAMLKGALAAVNDRSKRSIIKAVSVSADVGVGMHKVPDWNAHLSHGTYQRLKVQGIMS